MINGAWAYRSQWLPTGWTNHSLIRFLASTMCFLKPLYFKQSSLSLFLSLSFLLLLWRWCKKIIRLVQKKKKRKPNTKLIHTYKPWSHPSNCNSSLVQPPSPPPRIQYPLFEMLPRSDLSGFNDRGSISALIFRVSSPPAETSLETSRASVYRGCSVISGRDRSGVTGASKEY